MSLVSMTDNKNEYIGTDKMLNKILVTGFCGFSVS